MFSKKIVKAGLILCCLAALGAGAVVVFQWRFLVRRFWVYPQTGRALAALESQRLPRPREDGLTDFRGVLHAHSYLSHDSMGTPEEMIRGARNAAIDFVFLTDHHSNPQDRKAIEQGLRGGHSGVVFFPGVETSPGLIAWFLDRAQLDGRLPLAGQIAQVQAGGGVAFVCQPDEPRPWEKLSGFAGMEIYNLHADAKKSRLTFYWRLSENFWSMSRYPMRVYHTLFHDPGDYLAIWDRLTQQRPVVGIAGNDAHQTNGLRLVVTATGTLALTDTSPKGRPLKEWNNWLARRVAGRYERGATLWRWDADLYERSYHFVNTHLLAPKKTPGDLRTALEAGHAYVGFDSLVTASGFDFSYQGPGVKGLMGDQVRLEPGAVLEAQAPVPSLLRLIRNGQRITEQRGRSLRYPVEQPGVFRVEAHLEVEGRLAPWIYANPIYIH